MFCTILICYWFCQSRSLVLCPPIRVFGSFCLRCINACLLCMHVCICMYSFATACIHCLRCTKICLIAIHVSGSWRNNGDLWRLSDKSNVNSNCCRIFFPRETFFCNARMQSWYDFRLQWNPSHYKGVQRLYVMPTDLWLPDIVLYNRCENKFH